MEGPVIVEDQWAQKLSFDPAAARTVYRDGVLSSYAALQPGDLVYWSESMRTLWAYTTRVSGTITAITPSDSPTSVTLAGNTYSIETPSAAYALSPLGTYQVGDTATLLLGRSGGAAAVTDRISASSTLYGLIEDISTQTYTDKHGESYAAKTLHLIATDGSKHTFPCQEKYLRPGDLVEIFPVGEDVKIQRLKQDSVTGVVSGDGARLGQTPLAQNAEILDVYENTALRIFPNRLAGLRLTEPGMVKYYRLNAAGEITHLILNNVTGDLHQYGIVTSVDSIEGGLSMMSSYTYEVGGQTFSTGPISQIFQISVGPACFVSKKGSLDSMTNLTPVALTSLEGDKASAVNATWRLWENAPVYELRDNEYYPSSRSIVDHGGYTLTGYYDKPSAEGGMIRILVARPQAD